MSTLSTSKPGTARPDPFDNVTAGLAARSRDEPDRGPGERRHPSCTTSSPSTSSRGLGPTGREPWFCRDDRPRRLLTVRWPRPCVRTVASPCSARQRAVTSRCCRWIWPTCSPPPLAIRLTRSTSYLLDSRGGTRRRCSAKFVRRVGELLFESDVADVSGILTHPVNKTVASGRGWSTSGPRDSAGR